MKQSLPENMRTALSVVLIVAVTQAFGDISAVRLPPSTPQSLETSATVEIKYDEAIGQYEKELAKDIKIHGERDPIVAVDRSRLGAIWAYKGEYDKAIGYYEQALASDLKNYGSRDDVVAMDRGNLGTVLTYKGEYDKAIGYYEQALASNLKNYGSRDEVIAMDQNNLGLVWACKGEYDKAIDYYEQALKSLNLRSERKRLSKVRELVERNLADAQAGRVQKRAPNADVQH